MTTASLLFPFLTFCQSQNIDLRSIPWDTLVGAYKTVSEDGRDAISRLIAELAGIFAEMSSQFLDKGIVKPAICLMAAQAGKGLVRMKFHGGYPAFLRYLTRSCMAHSAFSESASRSAMKMEIERQGIQTWRLAGKSTQREWLALVDVEKIKNGNLAGVLHTVDELEALPQSRWQGFTKSGGRFAIASGILQVICFTKLISDFNTAMAHEKGEAWGRLGLGAAGLLTTFMDGMKCVLESIPARTLKLGAFGVKESTKAIQWLGRWGTRLGIGAAVVSGLWDGLKAFQAYSNEQTAFGRLYLGSAVTGVLSSVILCTKLLSPFLPPWVGWVMLAAFIGISIAIEKKKASRIQEWLKRSYWGTERERYQNSDIENKELELALA